MEENVIRINGGVMINFYMSVKNVMYVKNIIFGILVHAIVKKYLASIMDDLAIRCDDDIESYEEEEKTIPTSFNEKKTTYKSQNFYISLAFSLVTIALLIAVSIYCYLIQYRIKQKYLLPFYNRNSELKQILSW